MKRHIEAVQHSSKDPSWRTPARLFAALDQEFAFLIDAAAETTNKLAPHYFGPDHPNPKLRDGLSVDWGQYLTNCYSHVPMKDVFSRTAVFVNPPYSREAKMPIGPWVEKCWRESQRGVTVVGVIPYSPQTVWWRQWVEGHGQVHAARETRMIPHRVTFLRPDGTIEGNAGGNTAIVCWKPAWGVQMPWVPWRCYWEFEDFTLSAGEEAQVKAEATA